MSNLYLLSVGMWERWPDPNKPRKFHPVPRMRNAPAGANICRVRLRDGQCGYDGRHSDFHEAGLNFLAVGFFVQPIRIVGWLPRFHSSSLSPLSLGPPCLRYRIVRSQSNRLRCFQRVFSRYQEVQDYHVSLNVNISFKRTPPAAANAIIVSNNPNDPDAVAVNISEEDIRKQYPWNYGTLTQKLQNRYLDFKANNKYHELRKKLATNPQYMKPRYLDPGNPKSSRKDFYNPNIVAGFDKSYTLKK